MRRTSLSKAWSLIDRFSEDIDLTIDRECLGFAGDRAPEAATSRSEQQRRLQQLKQSCSVVIAEQIAPALMAHLDRLLAATEFPALFDSPTCTVRALLPERTFWEKVMLLHEETFRPRNTKRLCGGVEEVATCESDHQKKVTGRMQVLRCLRKMK